jgi:hypothetical protein
MRSYIIWIVLAGLISGCASAPTSIAVLHSQMAAPGECISGNCENGYGTRRYPDGSEIAANRVNGNMVAGDAEFRYSCLPTKAFTLTLNNAGRPVSGTIVRCGDLLGALESGGRTTFYTGTFQTISNPFTQEQTNTYQTGTYTDGNGVKWEGEFTYIPVRHIVDSAQWGKLATRKGSFVFMGAKIDAQFDEVVRGLYISEPVSPGSEIAFVKARPDYLAKLRSTFVAEREQDAAVREADARASRELFNNFVTIASVSAIAYGTYKMEQAASNRAHMDSLNQVITGQKSPAKANAQLPKGNQGEARIPAKPMTMAEYRNLQKTRQAQENTSIQQQEQERLQKQARLQEQAQLQKQALQQEQERKQAQARKKAEVEKTKLAEKQAEEQLRAQYLKDVAAGTRLVATKCPDGEGKYYATGTRPRIKPEAVSCVDVRFRAYCPGSRQFSEGTAHNFIGMAGCFGDTYDISPKPGCKVDQVRIEVVGASECGN